jgi:hypothetical protein
MPVAFHIKSGYLGSTHFKVPLTPIKNWDMLIPWEEYEACSTSWSSNSLSWITFVQMFQFHLWYGTSNELILWLYLKRINHYLSKKRRLILWSSKRLQKNFISYQGSDQHIISHKATKQQATFWSILQSQWLQKILHSNVLLGQLIGQLMRYEDLIYMVSEEEIRRKVQTWAPSTSPSSK